MAAADLYRPIVALIAGVQAPSGRVLGHAGAHVGAGEKDARAKIRNLRDAGAVMVNHPEKFEKTMKQLLDRNRYSATLVSKIFDSSFCWPR